MSEPKQEDSSRDLKRLEPVRDPESACSPEITGSAPSLIIRLPGLAAILFVRAYQYLISPLLGRTCRFTPSCSQYFILTVQKSGLLCGLWKGSCRICRCHPWNPGGYDPP